MFPYFFRASCLLGHFEINLENSKHLSIKIQKVSNHFWFFEKLPSIASGNVEISFKNTSEQLIFHSPKKQSLISNIFKRSFAQNVF